MSRSSVTTTAAPSWWPTPPAETSQPTSDPDHEPAATPWDGSGTIPSAFGGEVLNRLKESLNGPNPPTLVRFADSAGLADWVASLVLEDRILRPQRPLGLATGRTMEPIYAALARRVEGLGLAERQELRRRWSSFNLDEYVGLTADDRRSFAAEMHARLSGPLGLDPAAVRLPDGLDPDPTTAAERYAAQLAAANGIGLQLLGLGLNGHVGFNEPPCSAAAACRCVQLSSATRRQNAAAFGGHPDGVPERAITLGLREILAAERVLLVVTGAAKASVLARALREPPTPDLPASWLQTHPRVLVVGDGAAFSLLN